MRFYKNPQGKLGEINISEIILDKKNQDDVPRILTGLQTLHNDKTTRDVNKKVKVHHHRHAKVHH